MLSICAAIILSIAASAAYYNTYNVLVTIPDANGCSKMQGFAAGDTYLYCAKINGAETKQIIYRARQSDGTLTQMKNGDTNKMFATYLGHANDIVLANDGTSSCMYIPTMKNDGQGFVKLRYSGTTYYHAADYDLRYNGEPIRMGGAELLGKDTDNLYFLFFEWPGDNTGHSFYKATVEKNQPSGIVNVTHAFDIDYENAKVNGSVIDNISAYRHQGIGYKAGTDRLYVPMTYDNISVILVYDNVSQASGTIMASEDLSFRITSKAFPTLFEIESCENANGKLWFSCNRKTDPDDLEHDAICYFKEYTP